MSRNIRTFKKDGKEYLWSIKKGVLSIYNKTDHKPFGKWETDDDPYDMLKLPVNPMTILRLLNGEELYRKVE